MNLFLVDVVTLSERLVIFLALKSSTMEMDCESYREVGKLLGYGGDKNEIDGDRVEGNVSHKIRWCSIFNWKSNF